MTDNQQIDIGALMAEELQELFYLITIELFINIFQNVLKLQIYKDNIMSPDDFTKLIFFNVKYEKGN